MEFTITSLGDAAFLEKVLLGLALLYNDGVLAGLAKVGLIAAVIVVGFQGAFQAKAPAFQLVGLGLILYLGIFSTPATVVIEDVYTGQERVVSNVPLGIAAMGSSVSSIGYGLTEKFEQAFGTAEMSKYGWGNSLHVINAVRQNTLREEDLGVANTPLGDLSSFWGSWRNYIKDCTLTGMLISDGNWSTYANKQKFLDALQWDSEAYYTEIYTTGNGPNVITCKDAYPLVTEFSSQSFIPIFYDAVLGVKLGQSGVPTEDQLTEALSAIGLTVETDDYVLTAVVSSIFHQAVEQYYAENREWAFAAAVRDATDQRASQWLGESSLFEKFARPMLTVIEGFAYAVSPLIILLLGAGPRGMQVIGYFLITLLWIQLWMPLLAIVNLFTHLVLSGQMAALQGTGGLTGSSMAGLLKSDNLVQEWMGIAGMVASSIPILSYAIIKGGSVAGTAFLSRAQTGDYFNEKRTSPDLVQPAPKIQDQAGLVSDWKGTHRPDGALSFQVSSQALAEKAQSYQRVQQATQNFQQALGQAVEKGSAILQSGGQEHQGSRGRTASHTEASGHTRSESASSGDGTNIGYANSAGRTDANSVGGNLSVGAGHTSGENTRTAVGGNLPQGQGGASAGPSSRIRTDGTQVQRGGTIQIGANTSTSGSETMAGTDTVSRSEDKSITAQRSTSAQTAEAQASSIADRYKDDYNSNRLSKQDAALFKAASELVSASKSYQETSRRAQSIMTNMGFNNTHMEMLSKMPGAAAALQRAMGMDPNFARAVMAQQQSPWMEREYPNPNSRMFASAHMVASGVGPYQQSVSQEARDTFINGMAGSVSSPPQDVERSIDRANKEIDPIAIRSGIKERVDGAVRGQEDLLSEAPEIVGTVEQKKAAAKIAADHDIRPESTAVRRNTESDGDQAVTRKADHDKQNFAAAGQIVEEARDSATVQGQVRRATKNLGDKVDDGVKWVKSLW